MHQVPSTGEIPTVLLALDQGREKVLSQIAQILVGTVREDSLGMRGGDVLCLPGLQTRCPATASYLNTTHLALLHAATFKVVSLSSAALIKAVHRHHVKNATDGLKIGRQMEV